MLINYYLVIKNNTVRKNDENKIKTNIRIKF